MVKGVSLDLTIPHMALNLAIHKLKANNIETDLDSLPKTILNTLWNGSKASKPVHFFLAHSDRHLYFHTSWGIRASAINNPPRYGSYVEGLWESDLIELFLLDQESNIYQEFHLAPGGLWWSYAFSEPRVRIREFLKPACELRYQEDADSWSASLIVEKKSLAVPFEKISHGNICAYVGANPRQLLSLARLPGETANFHQPDAFIPLTFS